MKKLLFIMVQSYQYCISPFLGTQCRFEPSCSAYAKEALHHHGALRGSLLTVRRVLRCNPFCQSGIDNVPHINK